MNYKKFDISGFLKSKENTFQGQIYFDPTNNFIYGIATDNFYSFNNHKLIFGYNDEKNGDVSFLRISDHRALMAPELITAKRERKEIESISGKSYLGNILSLEPNLLSDDFIKTAFLGRSKPSLEPILGDIGKSHLIRLIDQNKIRTSNLGNPVEFVLKLKR